MNSSQPIAETASAPETASASGEMSAMANLGALQSIWARFAPGVVAVILAAGLSVVGWLMAQQIAGTEQDIMRLENRIVQVETRLREDNARIESKIDSLLAALATERAPAVN